MCPSIKVLPNQARKSEQEHEGEKVGMGGGTIHASYIMLKNIAVNFLHYCSEHPKSRMEMGGGEEIR